VGYWETVGDLGHEAYWEDYAQRREVGAPDPNLVPRYCNVAGATHEYTGDDESGNPLYRLSGGAPKPKGGKPIWEQEQPKGGKPIWEQEKEIEPWGRERLKPRIVTMAHQQQHQQHQHPTYYDEKGNRWVQDDQPKGSSSSSSSSAGPTPQKGGIWIEPTGKGFRTLTVVGEGAPRQALGYHPYW
jgi:hypothetical protein